MLRTHSTFRFSTLFSSRRRCMMWFTEKKDQAQQHPRQRMCVACVSCMCGMELSGGPVALSFGRLPGNLHPSSGCCVLYILYYSPVEHIMHPPVQTTASTPLQGADIQV